MTLEQNWTVAISRVQSLKYRTKQIYQDLKKALEVTSHFISVKLTYNAVSSECGTLKMTFIQSKKLQPIRFANHNSIDEVTNAKRGKSARLPSVFPITGWASRTRLFFNAKQSNGGIVFGTYWKCSVFNSHKFRRSFKPRQKDFSVRTCLTQNPPHLRSMEGWCVHKETKFITKSTFSSEQLSFFSKHEKYSRHSSLSSHSWVLSSLISSSCFSKALCKFCMYWAR